MRDRIRALFANARRQPGQALVIFAVAAPALIAALGLGVDVAYIFKERRALQNVADMAALSGVSQLPDNTGAARTIAVQIAESNGVDAASVTTNPGYNGNENQLEVGITQSVGLFFMPALGFDNVEISARAVAEHTSGKGTAIFAKKDTHCWDGSITWTGSRITVDGDAHSNSALTIKPSATDSTLTGDLTHGTQINVRGRGIETCSNFVKVGSGGAMPSGANIPMPRPLGHSDWPVLLSKSDFSCTFTRSDYSGDGEWWVGGLASGKQLRPGVYCADDGQTLRLNGDGISGNVTFRATNIELTLRNSNLTAFSHDVVAFAMGTRFPSLVLNVNGGSMTGMLYEKAHGVGEGGNQGGQVYIDGSNGFRLNGSVVAWAVTLAGNNWSIVNNLEGLSEPAHLVE